MKSNEHRNVALDFIKGSGVIVMIIHHSLDYFSPGAFVHRYVRFVTGLFILVTGFLVTNIYLTKYDITRDKKKISLRLNLRGIKILTLFIVLNLGIKLFITEDLAFYSSNLLNSLYTVFIAGNYKIIDFSLLIPISYILITLGIMIFVCNKRIWILIPISVCLLIYCSITVLEQQTAYNLRYVVIGITGAAIGFIQKKKCRWLHDNWYYIIFIYGLYTLTITFVRLLYPIYVASVLINFAFLYMLGTLLNTDTLFMNSIVLLGNYSLFGYLFQIAVLQILSRILQI